MVQAHFRNPPPQIHVRLSYRQMINAFGWPILGVEEALQYMVDIGVGTNMHYAKNINGIKYILNLKITNKFIIIIF